MPQVIDIEHVLATTLPRRREKLTEQDIRTIRELHRTGGATAMQLALSYGCTYSNVLSVLKRRTWKHVE